MYRATLELGTLEGIPPEAESSIIHALAENSAAVNLVWLRYHPETPLLYSSGVRYRRQKVGADRWLDIPRVLEQGLGSCTDLAPWRAAELRFMGENAGIMIKTAAVPSPDQGKLFMLHHVVVIRANGAEEDPSRLLGMAASSPELCMGGRCLTVGPSSAGQEHAMRLAGCAPGCGCF